MKLEVGESKSNVKQAKAPDSICKAEAKRNGKCLKW
jgi:hypothetical protein